jgi:hypothetical protein
MSRDLLGEATRALRRTQLDAPPAHEDRSAETRARVLATVRRQRLRRLTLIKTTLPIAAVLVASAAWASGNARLQASLRWITAESAPATAPATAPARATLVAASDRVVSAAAAAMEPAAPATDDDVVEEAPAPVAERAGDGPPAAASRLAAPVVTAPRAPVSAARSPVAAASAATPPPAAATVEAPRDDGVEAAALYAAAHRTHFGARSWSAALAAWDAYLAAAPRGRFATEARYNRAICLARLGRKAEARAALEPFAHGTSGAYRQREAQTLLEALGAP